MIRIAFIALLFLAQCKPPQSAAGGHTNGDAINEHEVSRILNILAADDMRGRKTFTPEIDRAAEFIAAEFRSAGLQTLNNAGSYLQTFAMMKAKLLDIKGTADGSVLTSADVFVFTSKPAFRAGSGDGFEAKTIGAGANLMSEARSLTRANKNQVVLVDKKHSNAFANLARLKSSYFKSDASVVFILAEAMPGTWEVEAQHEIIEQPLANVVAVLPGKSKASEYVIFSGHYDHVGVGKAVNGDSIYNGANDDASGVTATLLLAKHYAKLGPQERTLVFAAFTAEEVGGFGSQYFSRQFDPASIVAMFNIEMIGTHSKWGANSAFITGYQHSNLGSIMQTNLSGSEFTFHPDPYTTQQLFYRSDNATLARLGVPAHTISTAKMENEPHYHQVSDEVSTLDLGNMTKIIESIAIAAKSVVEGRETPSRVNASGL
jgi:hypothetical protein